MFEWSNLLKVWLVRLVQTSHGRMLLHWRTLNFNSKNVRPCPHIVIWVQWQTFLSLAHSSTCLQTHMLALTHGIQKVVRHNIVVPLPEHKIKWETALLMDGCYVVGVTVITYHGYRCIITIVSKKEKTYLIFVIDIP